MFSDIPKKFWQSKTVVTNLIMALFGVAAIFGFTPPVGAEPETVVGAVLAIGGVLGALFRVNATQEVEVGA